MKILIIVYYLFSNKESGDKQVTNLIMTSNIPEDCKLLYLSVTIKESGWHNNKKAILNNNYSGFRDNKGLKKFSSLLSYRGYLEKWFKRKNIKNNKYLYSLLKSGKYCKFKNNKDKLLYIKSINSIKSQIKNVERY